jgi:hypothetical protein
MNLFQALTIPVAIAIATAGMNPAAATDVGMSSRPLGGTSWRLAEAPQVRNSTKVVGPDHSNVKAKPASEVSQIICEGGEVKTASSGRKGCDCGLNVRRITVAKDHFRCDKPQVRTSTKVVGPDHSTVKAKPASEVAKLEADKPSSAGKPIPGQSGNSKPVSACAPALTATRNAAATRGTGLATAVAAWQHGAKQLHGYHMGSWEYAEDKSSSCSKGAVLWKCTVAARPCPPS